MARPSARDRLLDSAERLFADRGLAGASLRNINAEAGLSPAALHYHFGTREALVEALLERRMGDLMQRRSQLLDAAEASAAGVTVRDVLDALVRPLAELLGREREEGHRYLRFLSRLSSDRDLDHSFVMGRYREGIARLEPLLQCALPELPVSVVRLRLALAIELTLRGLADWEGLAGQWRDDQSPLSLEELVGSLLDFLTGALEAPSGLPLAAPTLPSASLERNLR